MQWDPWYGWIEGREIKDRICSECGYRFRTLADEVHPCPKCVQENKAGLRGIKTFARWLPTFLRRWRLHYVLARVFLWRSERRAGLGN